MYEIVPKQYKKTDLETYIPFVGQEKFAFNTETLTQTVQFSNLKTRMTLKYKF